MLIEKMFLMAVFTSWCVLDISSFSDAWRTALSVGGEVGVMMLALPRVCAARHTG